MKTIRLLRTQIKSASVKIWLVALMMICACSQHVTICSGVPTQTRLSGNHSATNNKHDSIVEQVKKNGQPESFSMEATGLGDLEEADAIRKMLRRSATQLSPLQSAINNDQSKNQVARMLALVRSAQDVNDYELALALAMYRSEASARDNLARYLAAATNRLTRKSQRKNHLQEKPQTKPILDVDQVEQQQEPPIMISRRTAEEFEGADQDLVDLDDDKLGEFSSRISFLTTRKIQPEEMLVDNSIMDMLEKIEAPTADADQQLSLTKPRDGAMVAGGGQGDVRPRRDQMISKNDALKSKNHKTPSKNGQPILIGANSNYLPRVARAASSLMM